MGLDVLELGRVEALHGVQRLLACNVCRVLIDFVIYRFCSDRFDLSNAKIAEVAHSTISSRLNDMNHVRSPIQYRMVQSQHFP